MQSGMSEVPSTSLGGGASGGLEELASPVYQTLQCSKHPDQQLHMYCGTCEELICRDCVIPVHRDHEYDVVANSFPKHKEAIAASVQLAEQQLTATLERLDSRHEEITEQHCALEEQIKRSIKDMQRVLAERKEELLSQVQQLSDQKLKSIAVQQEQLGLIASQLTSCRDFVQETLQTGTQGEILAIKKPFLLQVRQFDAEFEYNDPKLLVPKEEAAADIQFTHHPTDLCQALEQFGKIEAEIN